MKANTHKASFSVSLQVHNSFKNYGKNYGRGMSTFRFIIPLLHHVTILGQSMKRVVYDFVICTCLIRSVRFSDDKGSFFQELVPEILEN